MQYPNNRLRCSIVGRNPRSTIVVVKSTGERLAFEDRTGDLELLLELLETRSSTEAAVYTLTTHREGVSPAAAWSAVKELIHLELLGDDPQGDRSWRIGSASRDHCC